MTRNKGKWIAPLAVGLGALLLHGAYYKTGLRNLIDLGVVAVDSERILNGQVFGSDFVAPYGPGRYYALAALFHLFGTSMTTLCGLFLALRVIVDLLTYLIARRLMPLLPAMAAVLCTAFLHGPTHKGFLTAGIVWLNWAAACTAARPTRLRFLLYGMAVGSTALFRYDLGLVGAILALALCRPSLSKVPAFVAGVLAGFWPALILIGLQGPGRFFSFEWSRAVLLKDAHSDLPGIFASLAAWVNPSSALLSLVLLLSPVLAGFYLFMARKEEDRTRRVLLGCLALSGLLLLSQYAIEPKVNRLLQVGPPLFLCAFFLVRKQKALVAALLGLALWYGIVESGSGSQDSPAVLLHDQMEVPGPRAGFFSPPSLAEGLNDTLAWLEKRGSGETLFLSPTLPLIYFLAGRTNPTPITDFTYYLRNGEAQKWMLRELDDADVRIFISRPEIVQGFDPEKEAPLLLSGIESEFPVARTLSQGFTVRTKR